MYKSAACVVTLLLVVCSQGALAQKARDGGGAGNAQLAQQLQQLASERTALQNENTKLKAEAESLRKERDKLLQSQGSAEARSRASQAELTRSASDAQRLQSEMEKEKARMQELVTRFRETAGSLREVETDRNSLTQKLQQKDLDIKACTDRNDKLYALNNEVLDSFEKQGVWGAMMRREPFTRLKRNQLENLVDGYRAAAQDQKLPPAQ
jgi:colicin import membrane protein